MYVTKYLHTHVRMYCTYVHSPPYVRTYILLYCYLRTCSLCLTMHRLVLFKNFHKCSVLVCGGDGSFGWVLATLDRLDMHDQVRACSETLRSTAPTLRSPRTLQLSQLCPPFSLSLVLFYRLLTLIFTLYSFLCSPYPSAFPSLSFLPPRPSSHRTLLL